ncbi:MAG TPA: hypothetical protein VGB51_04040 [Actinomycetota bacterium]
MELGEPLDERQTYADATPGFVSLTEGLEDRRPHPVGDAGTSVVHAQQDAVVHLVDQHFDRGLCGRVLHRVANQVLDDPLELGRVDLDLKIADRVDPHAPGRGRVRLVNDAGDERPHVGELEVGLDAAALEPLQVEQVAHHAVQPPARAEDAIDQCVGIVLRQPELTPSQQCLGRAEDPGQRPSQIVGNGTKERVLHLVQIAKLIGRSHGLLRKIALGLEQCAEPGEEFGDDAQHRETSGDVERSDEERVVLVQE